MVIHGIKWRFCQENIGVELDARNLVKLGELTLGRVTHCLEPSQEAMETPINTSPEPNNFVNEGLVLASGNGGI